MNGRVIKVHSIHHYLMRGQIFKAECMPILTMSDGFDHDKAWKTEKGRIS